MFTVVSCCEMATILKPKHSLVGKNIPPVIVAIKNHEGEAPKPMARLRKEHPFESYEEEKLMTELESLTGVPAGGYILPG